MYNEKKWGGKITSSNKLLLLAIFCAFFISINTTYASDLSYSTNNTNFEKTENLNSDLDANTDLNNNEYNDVNLKSVAKSDLNDNEYNDVNLKSVAKSDLNDNEYNDVNLKSDAKSDLNDNEYNDVNLKSDGKSDLNDNEYNDVNLKSDGKSDLNDNEYNSANLNTDVSTDLNNNEYNNVKSNYSENIIVQNVKSENTNIISNVSENKQIEENSTNLTVGETAASNQSNNFGETSSSNQSNNFAAGSSEPSTISKNSILAASLNITKYVSKYGKLPNFVTIDGYKFSMPEYLYLASKTIQYLYKNIDSEIKAKYNVKNPKKPSGTNIKMKISSNSYYQYATRIANFISKYSTAPNFLKIGSSKMQYQSMVYIFAKILSWSNSNDNKLPNTLSVNIKKNSKLNKYIPKYVIESKTKAVSSNNLNSNSNDASIQKYLSSSKNCQVNDKSIKALASQITKNYKTTYDKAKAIFNWVRDKVSYSFYYNTKYGAKKTMTNKIGNCVDQSHLLVALSRASGIAAKYVHGTCKFLSGNTYGHVWAQIKVGNTWYVVDSTSSRNSFGVVKNWNTNSYKLHGYYSSLPF